MEELKELVRTLDGHVVSLRDEVAGYREELAEYRKQVTRNTRATQRIADAQRRSRVERTALWIVVVVAVVLGCLYIHDALQRRADFRKQLSNAHEETATLACFVVSYFQAKDPESVRSGFLAALSDKYGCGTVPVPNNPKVKSQPAGNGISRPISAPGVQPPSPTAASVPSPSTHTVVVKSQAPGSTVTHTRTQTRTVQAPSPSQSSPGIVNLTPILCGPLVHLTC